ncbi:PCMP-H12 [Acrasis kona]|uniref:PCMP-H12 n=1 Tax=Acrasis kona TaxID=1008807 RepID=A0AAW2YSD6_9EUKA
MMNKIPSGLRHPSFFIQRSINYRFYDAHKPVSAIQVINPSVIKPINAESTPSFFATEPIVNENTALEEILLTRLRERNKVVTKKTAEEKLEFRFIRRIDTQRLKQNTHLVYGRIKTIFDDMRITNFKPTAKIYYKAVNALIKCNRQDKAHELYLEMKSKFSSDEIQGGLMAYMISACKHDLDHLRAAQYMDEMLRAYESETMSANEDKEKQLQTGFNNLLEIYAAQKDVASVEQTIANMNKHGVALNERSHLLQVQTYAHVNSFEQAQFTIENMPEAFGRDSFGYLKNDFSILLMDSCLPQDVDTCQEIFDEIPHKDAMCFNSLMKKRIEAGQYKQVYDLYEKMKDDKVKAKQQVVATVLDACYHDGLTVPTVETDFMESVKKKYYGNSYIQPQNDFDMHRIRRYWRETKSVWDWKVRQDCVKDALKRILDKRQEHKDSTADARRDNLLARREQFVTMLSTRRRQEDIQREQKSLQKTLERLSNKK